MMRALIIDDELKGRKTLEKFLSRFCPQVNVVGQAESADQGAELIKEFQPDLLFLDIEMGESDGFSLIEQTSEYNYEVIMVTAYEQYAVKAFGFSVLDYLLKPIEITRLQAAVAKAAHAIEEKKSQKLQSKIALPVNDGYELLEIDKIVRCEANGNYTLLKMTDKSSILVSKTLKDFEEMFASKNFIRIHRHHLVNSAHIVKYLKTDGGKLLLSDGSSIGVSFRKRNFLLEIFRKL